MMFLNLCVFFVFVFSSLQFVDAAFLCHDCEGDGARGTCTFDEVEGTRKDGKKSRLWTSTCNDQKIAGGCREMVEEHAKDYDDTQSKLDTCKKQRFADAEKIDAQRSKCMYDEEHWIIEKRNVEIKLAECDMKRKTECDSLRTESESLRTSLETAKDQITRLDLLSAIAFALAMLVILFPVGCCCCIKFYVQTKTFQMDKKSENRPALPQAPVAMLAPVENRDDEAQPTTIEERPSPPAGPSDSSVRRRPNTLVNSLSNSEFKKEVETTIVEFGKVIEGDATSKSNSKFKKEVEKTIAEFGKLIEGHEDKLRSVVFTKKNFAIALVGQNGCRLGFTDGSAFLDIPAGALDADTTVYMYRLPEDTDVTGPNDEKKIFSYSPLICCGPEGVKFKENVTLNFEHWAAPVGDQGDVNLVVFGRDNENFPWQDTRNVFINGNRVEHCLSHFCQRCYGYEDAAAAQGTPGLRMCLMIAVSRDRRHHVETILMRDDTSVINYHKSNFIDVRKFAADEVHVIKGISIDPTQHVAYESGEGFRANSPNDWNLRHFYPLIIPTPTTGRFDLNLRQDNRQNAAIRISQQGDVDTDLESDQSFLPLLPTHDPVQAEPFGRAPIQCPDEARAFAEGHSLQSYDGNRSSREQRLAFPLDPNLGCLNLPLEEEMERQVQKTKQEEAGSARSSQRFERQGST